MNKEKVSIEELYECFLNSRGITTDSRQVQQGEIFFALRGENFNGNDYALAALEQGASFVVVDDEALAGVGASCLLVKDATETLALLANYHRRTFDIPLLLITGTNGKTTTKELAASVLNKRFKVLATEGNFNNHIGLPLTLLRLTKEHEIAIIEAGASHVGEIAFLAQIAEPNYGIITNIGRAHLEGFGSFEGVVQAKTELYDYLREHDGIAIVNRDDQLLLHHSEGLERILYATDKGGGYNFEEGPVVYGLAHDKAEKIHLLFTLQTGDEAVPVKTQLVGNYNITNALAAATTGLAFGMSLADIAQGLKEYRPNNHRSQLIGPSKVGNLVIADVYNANPSSMQTALLHYVQYPTSLKRAILLGDMLELGEASREEHRHIVELAAKVVQEITEPDAPLVEAYFIGETFFSLREVFSDWPHLLFFPSCKALLAYLKTAPLCKSLILLKASHGMHFEEIIDEL